MNVCLFHHTRLSTWLGGMEGKIPLLHPRCWAVHLVLIRNLIKICWLYEQMTAQMDKFNSHSNSHRLGSEFLGEQLVKTWKMCFTKEFLWSIRILGSLMGWIKPLWMAAPQRHGNTGEQLLHISALALPAIL